MSSVAESIQPKSGRASSSTKSGTTTTTASLWATAAAVSVVPCSSPAADDLGEVLGEVGLTREGLRAGVDEVDDRLAHVRAEDLVPDLANWTARGRPILPSPTTVIFTIFLHVGVRGRS